MFSPALPFLLYTFWEKVKGYSSKVVAKSLVVEGKNEKRREDS